MTPRSGLIVGAALAALVALILAFVPADWLARLLNVSGADATSFLVRRYGASATAALFVSTAAIVQKTAPSRAALLALSAWFGVQGLVAIWGIAFGHVGGLAWLAVVADPLIAGWFIALSLSKWSKIEPHSPRALLLSALQSSWDGNRGAPQSSAHTTIARLLPLEAAMPVVFGGAANPPAF